MWMLGNLSTSHILVIVALLVAVVVIVGLVTWALVASIRASGRRRETDGPVGGEGRG